MSAGKSIRVAAVQALSRNGEVAANLARAEPFIAAARSRGAQLLLLPELFSTGFELNRTIWASAEPARGPTLAWLRTQAARHSLWLGTSFLEAAGGDFYNTFILVDPRGVVAARVRKSRPAAGEAYVYRGAASVHVVDTPFGRVGICICYEAFLTPVFRELHSAGADLVLIPMSAPAPTLNFPVDEDAILEHNEALMNIAAEVAKTLGVPAVMANKTGPWRVRLPWPLPAEDSYFPGYTSIAGGDGQVISRLYAGEGLLVEDVRLEPGLKVEQFHPYSRKWVRRPPGLFRLFIVPETLGRVSYALSLRRRRAAYAVSGAGGAEQ